jgi:Ty3 transposon capsid-like protein/Zinc knuckle
MSSAPPATLQEALAQIQRMDAAGARIQNELAQAQQQIAAAAPVAPVVQVISHRAKIPSPTPFNGKIGTSIVDFLEQVENQFTYYAAEFPINNPVNMIQFALSWVSAEVLRWYRARVASTPINSWAEFKAVMRLQYQPIDSSHKARVNLDSAKQGGGVQAYTEYVQKQMSFIPNMSDDEQVHDYIRGLKENIAFEVAKGEPKTLIECIAIAVRTEAYSVKSRYPAPQSSSGSAYRPQQQRGTPMDINNVNYEFSDSPSESMSAASSRESPILAMIQQQLESQSRMQQQLNALFNKSQDRRSNKSPSSSSSSSSKVPDLSQEMFNKCREEDRCFKCKETGHIARGCSKPIRLKW